MRFSETLSFNKPEYTAKLEGLVASQRINEIREREVLKTRQIYGAYTKISMGVILAVPTAGMTMISSTIGCRQLWVACSKLKVIQSIIAKYGITPHQCSLRDRVIPIVTNVLTAGVGFGASFILGDIATMGMEQATAQGVTFGPAPGVEQMASSAVENPASFGDGFLHGAEAQVDGVAASLEPGDAASNVAQAHVENAVPASVGPAFMDGGQAGFEAAAAAERFLIQQAIASSLEHFADEQARRQLQSEIADESEAEQLRCMGEICDWHQELDGRHDALNVQYGELITAHSWLLNSSSNRRLEVADTSESMREIVVFTEGRARDDRQHAEEGRATRLIDQWISNLARWEKTLEEQVGTQAEWEIVIDRWRRELRGSGGGRDDEWWL